MTLTDDDLKTLLAPLATTEPTAAERAALRRAAASATAPASAPAPHRRLRGRAVGALAAATAVAGVALAVLPTGDQGARTSILHAAAAQAADEPVPSAADLPLRYSRIRDTFVYTNARDGRQATDTATQESEAWVGARWEGRQRYEQGHDTVAGDPELGRAFGSPEQAERTWLKPRDGAYAYGDGPLAELDPADLPSDRDGIAKTLREGIETDRWSPYPESRGKDNRATRAPVDSYLTYSMLYLLTQARTTPQQRAAMLDVLAADPAARDLGTVKDAEGRSGRGVALDYPGEQFLFGANHFVVIFDPDSSEILQWSMAPETPNRGTPARTVTVLAGGYVAEVGERP
jgi:hypothetical protein